jgi:hypothetical protein
VPSTIPADLRKKYSWLPNTDERENTKSVTEFEVLHGALNPESAGPDGKPRRSLFYFRNCDTSTADYPDRIEALKTKIKQSSLRWESYDNVKQLAKFITEDLKEQIENDFPTNENDELEMENIGHETYAEVRSKVYVPKQEYYNTIDRYLSDDSSLPLSIIGGTKILLQGDYRQ